MWLSCSTQDEIAERIGWPRQSVTDWLKGIAENPESGKSGDTLESDDSESPLRLTAEELAHDVTGGVSGVVMSGTGLIQYSKAIRELAVCVKVDEAKSINDKAEAMRVYAKQLGDVELETYAAEIKLRASRRIGELSAKLEKAVKVGGAGKFKGPQSGLLKSAALSAAGLTKQQVSRCEMLAAIPIKRFERYLSEKIMSQVATLLHAASSASILTTAK